MDRFASITAFVRVAESGGFSAAGRRLNLSKATVSDQVQALENTLGVRLLNRTTRRVSLTEIGRNYYERCAQILQDLEEADEAAGAQQATPRGLLRVYCHQGIGRFLAPIVADFLARYPEVSVDLRTGHAMIDLVQEAFDLGISPFPPSDSSLVRRRLGTLSAMVCGAPAYLETHPAPQSPADLAGHNCLHYPYAPSPDEWQFLDADGNPVVARISGSLISSSFETTHAAAMAGIGLILTSPFLVADLIASGALVPLLPGYRAQQLEINALYPHRRHLSAKVRAFIDMLVDRFAEQQRWLDAKIEQ
ncbi:MAG TPA: LysR family transcriptional regulator [Stellaceae bacterium]|jgi:DNA-binding transcriptional LysR family regulator|nr:LysR family transcriptional regulator [Stellaceae bacterium]